MAPRAAEPPPRSLPGEELPHARGVPGHRPGPGADDGRLVIVQERLREAVGGQGLLTEMAAHHLSGGGKRLRALLTLAACDALEVDDGASVPWATACEMLHGASLVHDDVQDGDAIRRGRPSVWARYGVPQAINLGDFMLAQALDLAASVPTRPEIALDLTRRVAARATEVMRGQADELALADDPRPRLDLYLRVVRAKTAALFVLPVDGAALLAGADPTATAALAEAVAPLGVVFQIADDLRDLLGEKDGRPPGGDLREGRLTAPVVLALGALPREKADHLRGILLAPRAQTTDADVAWATGALQECRALTWARALSEALAGRALAAPALAARPALHAVAQDLCDRVLATLPRV